MRPANRVRLAGNGESVATKAGAGLSSTQHCAQMAKHAQAGKGPMTLSDEELLLVAIREAQMILAAHANPGPRDVEKTISALLSVLERDDVVAAVDRPEAGTGIRIG